MDLLFNRKVVKPIRGGAAKPDAKRDSSINRRNSINNQMTFDQFLSNQSSAGKGNYNSVRAGRASVGAMRSPIRGGPALVKPADQKMF